MAMARRAAGEDAASSEQPSDANIDYLDHSAPDRSSTDRSAPDHSAPDHSSTEPPSRSKVSQGGSDAEDGSRAAIEIVVDPPELDDLDRLDADDLDADDLDDLDVDGLNRLEADGLNGLDVDDLNRLDRLDIDHARARRSMEPADSTDVAASGTPAPVGRAATSIAKQRRRVVAALLFAWMMIVVGMIAGFVYAEAQPDEWAAKAEIVLEPQSSQIDRYMATEVVWIASSSVIDRASAALSLERKYIDENLDVYPIDASTAIGVQFVDEDPDLAVAVVTAVVDSYLADVRNQPVSSTRSVYSARIDELRSARAGIEVELASVEKSNAAAEAASQPIPFPTEQRRLGLESEQILGQISGLEQQLVITDIEILNQEQATVVTPSDLLDERVSPTPITFAALGALVGGALAAATIFLIGKSRSNALRSL